MPYFRCIVLLKTILKEEGERTLLVFFLLTGFSNIKKKKKSMWNLLALREEPNTGRGQQEFLHSPTGIDVSHRGLSGTSVSSSSVNSEPCGLQETFCFVFFVLFCFVLLGGGKYHFLSLILTFPYTELQTVSFLKISLVLSRFNRKHLNLLKFFNLKKKKKRNCQEEGGKKSHCGFPRAARRDSAGSGPLSATAIHWKQSGN